MHVASSEHMGYFGNALDRRPTFHLQDFLRNDTPILRRIIIFYPVAVVPGVLVPIPGSTGTISVPSVKSRISYLNLLATSCHHQSRFVGSIGATFTISSWLLCANE